MKPQKTGISISGHGPVRTVDGEAWRVRYDGFDHWMGSADKHDKWTSWYHLGGEQQWLLDAHTYLPEHSNLAQAEHKLLGFNEGQ